MATTSDASSKVAIFGGTVVGGQYQLVRKIGAGSFGEVYLAFHINTGEEVAVKLERKGRRRSPLMLEEKVYSTIQGGVGIPRLIWHGQNDDFNIMVMDCLGPNLERLFNSYSRKFSLKTILMLADQMIMRVEYLHSKCFVHRDLKPENFLVGTGNNSNMVYLIDYGLSKQYRDSKTGQHIPYKAGNSLIGTARYASINAHLGIEQSPRDDLEAIAYILLYFTRGGLPWQGLDAVSKKEMNKKICEMKRSIPLKKLCEGHPEEFAVYLSYCRRLRFEDTPDYTFVRHVFRNLFRNLSYQYDYVFDWTPPQRRSTQESTASSSWQGH
ncbi:casein kinase I-like [Ctenodactylus gundi]